jgi:DUF4097 and DUF4098 domain-containing protein YvlB
MKILLMGASLFCLSFATLASEAIDRKLDVAADSYVKIEHINGHAEIKAWDQSQIRVLGSLGDNTKEFIFERNGNDVLIKVKVENNRGRSIWHSNDGDKLEIFVPKMSQINYSAVNANVMLEGIQGGARVETVNGDIGVSKLAGRIRLEAVNGDIVAENLVGNINIETVNGDIYSRSSQGSKDFYDSVNGDIDVTSHSSYVSAETVNGDIDLTLKQVSFLNLSTINGGIDASMQLQPKGELEASSVGGSINLYFQEDVSARFDIQGHGGGNIVNKLSADKMQKAKYGPSRWLEFSLNDGSAKVDVSTVSGTVKLAKK